MGVGVGGCTSITHIGIYKYFFLFTEYNKGLQNIEDLRKRCMGSHFFPLQILHSTLRAFRRDGFMPNRFKTISGCLVGSIRTNMYDIM